MKGRDVGEIGTCYLFTRFEWLLVEEGGNTGRQRRREKVGKKASETKKTNRL